MKEQLEQIKARALQALQEARDSAELEALRVGLLGKKGELTAVLKMMGKLSPEERPVMGQLANETRAAIEAELEHRRQEIAAAAMERKLAEEARASRTDSVARPEDETTGTVVEHVGRHFPGDDGVMVAEDEAMHVPIGRRKDLHGRRTVADEIAEAENAVCLEAGDVG